MAAYKIVPFDSRNMLLDNKRAEMERMINANATQGWDLDRFEDPSEDLRFFYFKKNG